ncbi:MAG: hypothetical protein KDC44_11640, partial [Phaeodactylibacter sp.]|nr:hypothetical protein [Phaeodactylibacter sp.]
LPVDGEVLVYADPFLLEAYVETMLSEKDSQAWRDLLQGPSWWIGKVRVGALTLSGFQEAVGERKIPVLVDWHTPLDAEIERSPQLLEVGGIPLILVQDARHQLYGLDEKGVILWKKQLDQRVMSDFQLVRLFDHAGEQIIFNTTEQLYFINQKGEDLPGYPKALPATASNGLRVLHFNDRQDFAYLFACTDGTLYALDRTGKALPGWNPKDSLEQVVYPVEHFQTPGKDFILVLAADTLYVFQRDGKHRFPPMAVPGPFLQGPKYQLHALSDRIVLCNAQGRAEVINTEGASFGLQLEVGNRQGVVFDFADISGDDRKDYLVLSGKALKGYRYTGNEFKPFLNYSFPKGMDGCFALEFPNRQGGIGTYSKSGREIYLVDAEGQLVRGFPLAGDTPWFIFQSATANAPLAVVGLGAEVYAYDLSRCF